MRSSTSGCSLLIIISARSAGQNFRQFARMQHAFDGAIHDHPAAAERRDDRLEPADGERCAGRANRHRAGQLRRAYDDMETGGLRAGASASSESRGRIGRVCVSDRIATTSPGLTAHSRKTSANALTHFLRSSPEASAIPWSVGGPASRHRPRTAREWRRRAWISSRHRASRRGKSARRGGGRCRSSRPAR